MNLQILFVTVLLSNFVSFKSHATKAFSDFRNICEQRTETLMKSKTGLDIK